MNRKWFAKFQQPKEPRNWYQIKNQADTGTAEIYIYDVIGQDPWSGGGVGAADFVQELNGITQSKIDLHINTPGGDVFEGIAIYQALKDHPAEVTSIVDSLAASAGSFIAMSGDRVIMQKNAQMMIHRAMGGALGYSDDMRKMADELDRFTENIASIYADRAGGEVSAWMDLMTAETWFNAEEAVTAGLADQIGRDKNSEDPSNNWDLSAFNFQSREQAPAPNLAKKNEREEQLTLPDLDFSKFRSALKGANA